MLQPVLVREAAHAAGAVDHGLLVLSTHATPDGFTGDHTVLAPAFIATDDDLAAMLERFAAAARDAETAIKHALADDS